MVATDLPSSDRASIQSPDLMKLSLLVSMLISVGSSGFRQMSVNWEDYDDFVHSQNVLCLPLLGQESHKTRVSTLMAFVIKPKEIASGWKIPHQILQQ